LPWIVAISVVLDRAKIDNPLAYTMSAKHALITYGPGAANFRLTGEDVTTMEELGIATLTGCGDT
jgi:hypothetical protein